MICGFCFVWERMSLDGGIGIVVIVCLMVDMYRVGLYLLFKMDWWKELYGIIGKDGIVIY